MKVIIAFIFSFLIFNNSFAEIEKNIYEKIDLFSEVLNKIEFLCIFSVSSKYMVTIKEKAIFHF